MRARGGAQLSATIRQEVTLKLLRLPAGGGPLQSFGASSTRIAARRCFGSSKSWTTAPSAVPSPYSCGAEEALVAMAQLLSATISLAS